MQMGFPRVKFHRDFTCSSLNVPLGGLGLSVIGEGVDNGLIQLRTRRGLKLGNDHKVPAYIVLSRFGVKLNRT